MNERERLSQRRLSDIQSGTNKWLFSLKKSNDTSRKHYERYNSITDPDRALWVQINEVKPRNLASQGKIPRVNVDKLDKQE